MADINSHKHSVTQLRPLQQHRFADLTAKVSQTARDTTRGIKRTHAQIGKAIQANPRTAMALSLAVGMLLGRLFSKRLSSRQILKPQN